MATLRPIEERDSKGNLIRLNPSTTFVQDREIRKIKGRHDYDLIDNPAYHQPITVQVQGQKLFFFYGRPNSTNERAVAKEITVAEVEKVAPYILAEIRKNPIRVREARPMVYEVKLAQIGDGEAPTVVEHEMARGATELTVDPVAPERYVGERKDAATA